MGLITWIDHGMPGLSVCTGFLNGGDGPHCAMVSKDGKKYKFLMCLPPISDFKSESLESGKVAAEVLVKNWIEDAGLTVKHGDAS